MEDKKLSGDGEPKFSDIGKWFENFWYHYKFHTIVGIVALITLTICITQIATRDEHDYQILYAGPQVIALQDRAYMEDAVEEIVDDYNGDGKIVISFDDIVMLSPEEQQAAADDGAVFNGEFNMNSMTEYYQQIVGGDAVICILSPYMYGIVREGDGFLPLSEVLGVIPESAYDDYGVLLLKTEFGQYFNGMNDLPEDTILCVRRLSTMAKFKGEEKTRKAHEASLELFRKMVSFTAPDEDGTTSDVVTVADIVDRTKTEMLATDDALEGFFADDDYYYFFPSIKSQYITVVYSDGTSENVIDAFGSGRVRIADLERFDIGYYAEPKLKITNIVYHSEENHGEKLDVLDYFWEDLEYNYCFSNPMSDYVIVEYNDGSTENIKQALTAGRAGVSDLDRFDIPYYAEPKVTDIEYEASFIRADSMSDGGLGTFIKYSENPSSIAISSTQHILIAHIPDKGELDMLRADISQYYQTNIAYGEQVSFDEKVSMYDDAFFEEKALLILSLSEGSGSICHEVEFVRGRKSPRVYVCIKRITPEVGTCDMADWFAIIEVSKSDIDTALGFNAWYYR